MEMKKLIQNNPERREVITELGFTPRSDISKIPPHPKVKTWGTFPEAYCRGDNVSLMTHLKAYETRHSEPFREERRTVVGVRHGRQSIDVRLRLRSHELFGALLQNILQHFPGRKAIHYHLLWVARGCVINILIQHIYLP